MRVLAPIDEHLTTVGVGGSLALCFGVTDAASATSFVG